MNSIKKLTGKEVAKKDSGVFGIKDKQHEKDLYAHDDHHEEEDDYNRHLLNQKLRREHTNGNPNEGRGRGLKDRFHLGSTGYLGSTGHLAHHDDKQHATVNVGEHDHSSESKM